MSYSTFIPALRQWLTPPTFPDKEQTRAARWLNILLFTLITLIVIDSAAILTGLLDQSTMGQIITINGIGLVLSLVTLWLMRQGHVKVAAIILLTTVYGLITFVDEHFWRLVYCHDRGNLLSRIDRSINPHCNKISY